MDDTSRQKSKNETTTSYFEDINREMSKLDMNASKSDKEAKKVRKEEENRKIKEMKEADKQGSGPKTGNSGNNKDFSKKKFGASYFATIFLVMIIFNLLFASYTVQEITYSEFERMAEAGKIEAIEVSSSRVYFDVIDENGIMSSYYADRLMDPNFLDQLKEWGIQEYKALAPQKTPLMTFFMTWVLPLLFFVFVGRWLINSMGKKMGANSMQFGKNAAKIYAEDETGLTFQDVAGQDEAKESLKEIVDFLHNPHRYTEIGARLPKGALLVGPPGTGKTLLAKAVAGEAKVPFFSISGSDFVEMFVGMGASKVRDLFKQAQEKSPCIIFIDEIDTIGKSRDSKMGGNDEREQTLNQLLTEMDGFDSASGVVLLAATNRPEILDQALLRPGRFDRRVIVDRPDLPGRLAILEVHSKAVKLAKDVKMGEIAKATSGAVGADLANMINEAALRAVRLGRNEVAQADLEESIEVVIAGEQKKDRILSDFEKMAVSYHEVGHALVAALLENTNRVHKITIVPRTMGALGYTMQMPDKEKYLITKEEMLDQIAVILGGRAAEEVKFNQMSSGASNDIEKATAMARRMVTQYGMSEKFDMMALERSANQYLGGGSMAICSEKTMAEADDETLKIIRSAHDRAIQVLKENEELLNYISERLLERETVNGEEFEMMIEHFKNGTLDQVVFHDVVVEESKAKDVQENQAEEPKEEAKEEQKDASTEINEASEEPEV